MMVKDDFELSPAYLRKIVKRRNELIKRYMAKGASWSKAEDVAYRKIRKQGLLS